MLEMRTVCETCGVALPPDSQDARICSYECTFCSACAVDPLGGRCPNCQGGLVPRPARTPLDQAAPATAREVIAAYRPREFRFQGVIVQGGWRLKRYSIRYLDRPPVSEDDWAAVAAISEPLLNLQASAGYAFCILHYGSDGDYLLIDWWSDGEILNQRLYFRAVGETRFRDTRHRNWMACVWELQIVDAERRAWTDTALSRAEHLYPSRHFDYGCR
jgi:hypothetical protein